MKTFFNWSTLILLITSSVNVFSQESSSKDQRSVSSFSAIEASGIAQVYLIKGDEEKVVVDVNQKDLNEKVIVKVHGSTLQIKFESRNSLRDEFKNAEVKVYVTYKALSKISGSGATTFHTETELVANNLTVDISGANSTTLNLNVMNLKVGTSGASNATLSGKVTDFSVEASGASNIKAYQLIAENVKAEASGVANLHIAAVKTIEMHASGLSNINYKGNAQVIAKEVSKMANANKQ